MQLLDLLVWIEPLWRSWAILALLISQPERRQIRKSLVDVAYNTPCKKNTPTCLARFGSRIKISWSNSTAWTSGTTSPDTRNSTASRMSTRVPTADPVIQIPLSIKSSGWNFTSSLKGGMPAQTRVPNGAVECNEAWYALALPAIA
jgi:hypothetical protein